MESNNLDEFNGVVLGGRYQLGNSIGDGGQGSVYRAWDRRLKRVVAVKMASFGTMAGTVDGHRRFRREASTLIRLSTISGVVSVFDYGIHDSNTGQCPFLVMRFVEGKELRQLITSDPNRDPVQKLSLIVDMATVLAEVHAAGIVHRDIKPHNILVQEDDTPILVDFGIAQDPEQSRLTAHSAAGTPAYRAPETHDPEYVPTPASDIYSLALTAAFTVLGRRPPATGAANQATIRSDMIDAGVVEDKVDVIIQGLAEDPDLRPTAAEFASRLSDDPPHIVDTDDAETYLAPFHTIDQDGSRGQNPHTQDDNQIARVDSLPPGGSRHADRSLGVARKTSTRTRLILVATVMTLLAAGATAIAAPWRWDDQASEASQSDRIHDDRSSPTAPTPTSLEPSQTPSTEGNDTSKDADEPDNSAKDEPELVFIKSQQTGLCVDSDYDGLVLAISCDSENEYSRVWEVITVAEDTFIYKDHRTHMCLTWKAATKTGSIYTTTCSTKNEYQFWSHPTSAEAFQTGAPDDAAVDGCLDHNSEGSVYRLECNYGSFQTWASVPFEK